MNDFFDKALHYLGKKQKETTALNIGAMDGVMFDEMIGYTNMYGFKVLYVEPIPYLFQKLKSNIKSDIALFENSAISDYNGDIEMMIIDKAVIDAGLVHSCFYGMSSVYPPKNGLGKEFDKETVDKYGQIVTVPCITFENLLTKHNIYDFDIVKIDAEGHDYQIFKQIDLSKYSPKVVRLEWINLTEEEQENISNIFDENDYVYEVAHGDITAISKKFYNELNNHYNQNNKVLNIEEKKQEIIVTKNEETSKITLVTGLWDIKRSDLSEGWNRTFDHYLSKFDQLLKTENNMIIFGDENLQKFVFERRGLSNTLFVKRDLSWFKQNDFYGKIQQIRNNPNWFNQSGWLKDSTQAKLEWYNPLVMSKMFLLHDAKILDKFDSSHLFWIDAGITNTVHPGYFTHDKIQNKLSNVFSDFGFVAFPYEANTEIHGFTYPDINEFAGEDVKLVCRGGLFGGTKESISKMNSIYYNTISETLSRGYMGTEESLFSIMLYKHPESIEYVQIDGNGLINKFCEDLKNNTYETKRETTKVISNLNTNKVGLYVVGFNSPNQFHTLITSMLEYDKDYIEKTKKFLLDNSTDESTTPEYKIICEKYGFEHIKKDNLGICGGRQWIAEHFDKTDLDYYLFFEDDMFFYPKKGDVCRNGFNRYVENLYSKTLQIIKQEDYDFLKYNFSEFFGDNSTQWSWYNVPQSVRQDFWPEKSKLPVQGLDPNAPRTKFNNIKSLGGVPYADGEIYYCNWPQIVSRTGNKKMFLNTTWAHPFEQTWMSHMYQLTKKGELKSSILLMTPTEHNRFDHYERNLRKES
jgi:FkbM family methyltransferase